MPTGLRLLKCNCQCHENGNEKHRECCFSAAADERDAARAQVVALRAMLAEARRVLALEGYDRTYYITKDVDSLLADTAAAAQGWVSPELVREAEEALEDACDWIGTEGAIDRPVPQLGAVLAKLRTAK